MSITITVADPLAEQLRMQARKQHLQVEEFVSALLRNALQLVSQYAPTPEEVVANIKATPPTAANLRPATASLRDALRHAPEYPDFDVASWEQAWRDVEQEMKTAARANAIAEGRR